MATRRPPARKARANLFHNRCFAGPADGEIPDADDETTQRAFAQGCGGDKETDEAGRALVDEGKRVKQPAEQSGPRAVTPLQNDVDRELLEIFSASGSIVRLSLSDARMERIRAPLIVGGRDDGARPRFGRPPPAWRGRPFRASGA